MVWYEGWITRRNHRYHYCDYCIANRPPSPAPAPSEPCRRSKRWRRQAGEAIERTIKEACRLETCKQCLAQWALHTGCPTKERCGGMARKEAVRLIVQLQFNAPLGCVRCTRARCIYRHAVTLSSANRGRAFRARSRRRAWRSSVNGKWQNKTKQKSMEQQTATEATDCCTFQCCFWYTFYC